MAWFIGGPVSNPWNVNHRTGMQTEHCYGAICLKRTICMYIQDHGICQMMLIFVHTAQLVLAHHTPHSSFIGTRQERAWETTATCPKSKEIHQLFNCSWNCKLLLSSIKRLWKIFLYFSNDQILLWDLTFSWFHFPAYAVTFQIMILYSKHNNLPIPHILFANCGLCIALSFQVFNSDRKANEEASYSSKLTTGTKTTQSECIIVSWE